VERVAEHFGGCKSTDYWIGAGFERCDTNDRCT
jgi:hypothetical protein